MNVITLRMRLLALVGFSILPAVLLVVFNAWQARNEALAEPRPAPSAWCAT